MPLLIGIDEAGYGPNLGPLLLAATVWEVPGKPTDTDLFQEFSDVVRNADAPADGRLLIADSKQVYSPSQGLAALELGVFAGLRLWSHGGPERDIAPCFHSLVRALHRGPPGVLEGEPWYDQSELPLPLNPLPELANHFDRWSTCCQSRGITLRHIAIDLVSPQRFNALNSVTGSKGRSLSELSLRLLRACLESCQATEGVETLVLADKHGGRNRYHEFLPLCCDDAFITCLEEGAQRSRYRAGAIEFRFETKAERHLPTALASMVAKYVRELSMRLFNRYWQSQIPGLKATAGYPLDAVRFRREISARQRELAIRDEILWRAK
ncbi:MAG: hypothetical protein NT069_35365 [Planctomycetota bacterium]|nr:hypothetical protein [Planctomycetota bacterium]